MMHQHHSTTTNKRKLDDQIVSPVRMQKTDTRIQFFVRSFPQGKTLVIQADSTDTVELVHAKIKSITGIPTEHQRLIYQGKQLRCEDTLADCGLQNNTSMQLVGRMQSTMHPKGLKLVNDLVLLITRILKINCPATPYDSDHMIRLMKFFLTMTPKDNSNIENRNKHLQIFSSSPAPSALVMLYMSSYEANKCTADKSVRSLINSFKSMLPYSHEYGHIILEFCKLLRGAAGPDDCLFKFCRSSLGAVLASTSLLPLKDVLVFVWELASDLSHALKMSIVSHALGSTESTELSSIVVDDFKTFMFRARLQWKVMVDFPLKEDGDNEAVSYREYIECLHYIFYDLLDTVELCLRKLEDQLESQEIGKGKPIVPWWSQYLVILKELNSISKLFSGLEKVFWQKMEQRKDSLCFLVMTFAQSSKDYQWVLEHKEVANFELRRHYALMMLPKVSYRVLHEMLIDRSQLLEESFEYIGHANPALLRGSLFMKFKHEKATGPGVLREWFFLVCRAIFNPQNALFVACPNDRRRFYPNPASKVDPLHLDYFRFSGRMIALALMHKIQIGIVFDRIFILQLAGKNISLEDIRDADPYLYNSCKQILEMDPETVDQDTLGLTFVCEVEELGSRKVAELCPSGQNIVLNSKNRKEYVDLLIQHQFVTSIAEQVAHFAQGFADITASSRLQNSFFRSLDLQDLDWMLDGSGSAVSVEDWKAHTDYNGYKASDPQISWFWKIVGLMSAEQRKALLFFWTSIKHLPIEGFGGLDSRLYIYKTSQSYNHLPSAQTCFYRICFPPYRSMAAMQNQLRIITNEHIGCSFGTR